MMKRLLVAMLAIGLIVPAAAQWSSSKNPPSTLPMTSATTAYVAATANFIASSATAANVVNPSFQIAATSGGALISRLRLSTNDATSTAWASATIQVDLWSANVTWTNGDRAAWSPATGTGSHLGAYICVMSAEFGDGAYAECYPTVGNGVQVQLGGSTTIWWSLQAVNGSGVTGASKTFTLTPEFSN